MSKARIAITVPPDILAGAKRAVRAKRATSVSAYFASAARARARSDEIERLLVPLQNAVERLTARVGENEDCPPLVTRQCDRLRRPRGLKIGCERVFVLQPPQTLGQRLFRGRNHYQDGRRVAVLSGAVKGEFRTFTDGLQKELGRFCVGRYPRRHGCATFRLF